MILCHSHRSGLIDAVAGKRSSISFVLLQNCDFQLCPEERADSFFSRRPIKKRSKHAGVFSESINFLFYNSCAPQNIFFSFKICDDISTKNVMEKPLQPVKYVRLCFFENKKMLKNIALRVNKWMNFITYIPLVKPDGQAQGCILRRSMVISPLGNDSPVRM